MTTPAATPSDSAGASAAASRATTGAPVRAAASTGADGLLSGVGRTVLLVTDADAALAFYREVLGFRVLHDETTGGYRYLHIGVPGQDGTGLWLMPAGSEGERGRVGRQCGDQPLMVLYTSDIDRVAARLRDHGVRVWAEHSDPGSRSLHFADLYGNAVVVAQLTGLARPAS